MDDPQRAVFRDIAQARYTEWPAYDSTPLYNRSSLDALQEDVRTVGQRWFKHDHHGSVEDFVCQYPLAYFRFDAHDRYEGSTRYKMEPLFRVFVLKELHGYWAVTDDTERLEGYSGYERATALFSDQLGAEDKESWHEHAPSGSHPSAENEQ